MHGSRKLGKKKWENVVLLALQILLKRKTRVALDDVFNEYVPDTQTQGKIEYANFEICYHSL